ncbi:MAG: tetratricopeptide repeat protein [Candidatus Helarchaeota archaeon]|nr:tetratricopeptide repeat protein [Candidatus Helarchaeota archaeon]
MDEISRGIDDQIKSAELLISSNSFQKAIDCLLDIINFFDVEGNFEKRDEYLLKINKCHRFLANQSQKHQDYFEAAETYCSAGFLQKEHDNNELAHQLFNAAIECYICAGKKAIKEKNYIEASRLYCSAAKYTKTEIQNKTKAREYYQKAIEILQKEIRIHENNDDPTNLCRTQLELGKIYEYLDDYQEALNQYQKVVECSTQKGFQYFIAECFQHMASCHEYLGNNLAMIDCLNKAVSYRLAAAEKFSKNDLPLEAVQNFIAAANCVTRLNDSDELLKEILQNEVDCFLTVAKSNIEKGKILQAAYYERNAAYCLNQLGQAETSIDLLLAAAEKLLSINEYYGAANNFQDASLYQERVGNLLKAANYAVDAADLAKQSDDLELAVQNYLRAAQIYQTIGYYEKTSYCNSQLAEYFVKLAEPSLKSNKFHIAAFLYYRAATFYSKVSDQGKASSCYERAIKYYEKAINIAMKDDERLLASYSACCATLVCLIMQQPARAEIILHDIRDNSPNNYYQLSDSIIRAFKTKNSHEYSEIHQKFYKIIQNSPEIKNLLDLTENHL